MPEGKHIYRIVFSFVMIKRHITSIPKRNNQFTQFWKIIERSAYLWLRFQKRKLLFYRLTSTHCRLGIFFSQKLPASFQSLRCTFSNNYS